MSRLLERAAEAAQTTQTAAATRQDVSVYAILRDRDVQRRVALDLATVGRYTAAMEEAGGWGPFPPVTIYRDDAGRQWLADGHHRINAFLDLAGVGETSKVPALILRGDKRDAILHALGANTTHGLPRSLADNYLAVETMLIDDEWGKWSDRKIANTCGVSPTFVGRVRRALNDPTQRPSYAPAPLRRPAAPTAPPQVRRPDGADTAPTVHVDSNGSTARPSTDHTEAGTMRTYERNGQVQTMRVDAIGARTAQRTSTKPAGHTAPALPPSRESEMLRIFVTRGAAIALQKVFRNEDMMGGKELKEWLDALRDVLEEG